MKLLHFFCISFGESKKSNGHKITKLNHFNVINGQRELNDLDTKSFYQIFLIQKMIYQKIATFGFNYAKELTNFIWENINEEDYSPENITILNTSSTINVELLNTLSKDLLINTHPINDFRRINEYLLASYSKLKTGKFFSRKFYSFRGHANKLKIKNASFPIFYNSSNLFYFP